MRDYCAGCGGLRPRHDMQFVCGYLYRCDHCRGDVERFQAGRPNPKPRRLRISEHATAVKVAATIVGIVVGVGAEWDANSNLDEAKREQQQQIRDAEQHADERDRDLQQQVAQWQWPGQYTDGPTEQNGAHLHCAESRLTVGINLEGPGIGGTACRWEMPNGDLAPPPNPLPSPPTP